MNQKNSRKRVLSNKDGVERKKPKKENEICAALTITFSTTVENHIGMEKIGTEKTGSSVSHEELSEIEKKLKENFGKSKVELHDLNESLPSNLKNNADKASVLVFKNGVDEVLKPSTTKDLFDEHRNLNFDQFYYDTRRKQVLNKHARYNVCYADKEQKPDYENKKGTIIPFDEIPLTKKLRETLPDLFGKKAENLNAEGNFYHDLSKTGIGYHGDKERDNVYGIRCGANFPLCFQWYQNSKPVGEKKTLELEAGDIYVMSKKAVGTDWRKYKDDLLTIRHAAGCKKYTNVSTKSPKKKAEKLV
jgi:hypothetical protein